MTNAIELSGVEKSFGPTEIIRGLDLAIAEGEIHAIIGPNGAGKSTLYNLISGLFPATTGTIRLRGEDISGATAFQ
ncbi:MAG: ATP-binding cassette domain-containing protein, partial [Rhodospirillaceae bacterium]|nr:ATP-binding cassette domain-containing protein [Rhodospirillaceae bacterium]